MNMASGDGDRDFPEEIERRRVLFEQTWGQPSAPSIEQLLDEVPQTERPDLLRELLYVEFEFTQRKAAELLIEKYLERFPTYESIVREVADAVGRYTVFKRRSIAGYTLLDELGRGGMGVVYRAKSDLLNNFVAFKMVNQRMVGNPETLRRFTRELEMIGRLRHPNIVEAKHAGIAPDGSPFLVMELIEGITLSQWSRQNPPPESSPVLETKSTIVLGTLPVSDVSERKKPKTEKEPESSRITKACAIIHDIALGLQAIHEAGLVHRDVKPGNIMLLPDGRVKILDLGLAKLREHLAENILELEPQTRQGHLLGTPGYIAPEQMHSAVSVDIRADIYSLGCTFFFLLYGRAPAENQSNELPVSLPKKLRAILDKMLASDPASRFQEPREVISALHAFLAMPRRFRWDKIVIATAIPVFLCGVALLFVSKFQDRSEPPPSEIFMTKTVISVENAVEKRPTAADVRSAVDLRYRGDGEQASKVLRTLEADLRTNPFDGSTELLAEVLTAQGDCLFFAGLASDVLTERSVKRLAALYEEALELSANAADDLRTKLLCKLVVAGDPIRLLSHDEKIPFLYRQFAEAATATDDRVLRSFAEQFELSTESELMTHEARDLRLFALERLISRSEKTDRENLSKDLRSLDVILLAPYPDADSCVYLNRFFDLAIRACDPTDYSQLVKYLCRLRPQGPVCGRTPLLPGATLVLIYFSPWSDDNGFAIYYPAERQEVRRFELPFNRTAVKEAIKRDESLALDTELVSLIRRDIDSGVPIVLSWDDTACWPLRRDAFDNEDWPFDQSITVEEILGQMK